MPFEIEKKYRLTAEEAARLRVRLREVGDEEGSEEFEVNTLYAGASLDPLIRVLRLRRVGERAVLTYKERGTSPSAIKRHREEETEVADAEALAAIFEALGYRPALIYEKRRTTWGVAETEVVVDELPFGLFVEIEGEEEAIIIAERLLDLSAAEAVQESYPELTLTYGTRNGDVIESRFVEDKQD
ncbi:MAG: class IV adenylate cyclase [Acidobacteriota bacterium]|nr:class IV adenylate cyclase [Acidobacteriota bacterium]